ncbi:MAG: hypothetical protein V4717_08315 [Bacteroidota bacterium]
MENFDKQIKKQSESFSLEPRQEVWLRLKDELKSKRTRRFAWWWFVPIILATGGAGIYFLTAKQGKQTVQSNNVNPEVNKVNPNPENSGKQANISTKENQAKSSTTISTKQASTTDISTKTNSATGKYKSKNVPVAVKHQKGTNPSYTAGENKAFASKRNTQTPNKSKIAEEETITASTQIKTPKQENINSKDQGTSNETTVENSKFYNAGSPQTAPLKEPGALKTETVEKKTDAPLKTTSETATSNSKQAISTAITTTTPAEKSKNGITSNQPKERKWKFILSAGVSLNTEAYEFLQRKNTDTGQLGGIGGGGILAPMAKIKPGISILLGVNRTEWISKRWQWRVGASAQLQQVHQKTGVRWDGPILPSPDNDYGADYFFDSGEELDHRGNNYRLYVSGKAGFMPVKKIPALILTAGISGGVNLHDRYLLPDSYNVWYIRKSDRYEKIFGAVNAGTEYTFNNGWSAGMEASHDFTKSFKPLDKQNNYWRSLMINIGIPLNIK